MVTVSGEYKGNLRCESIHNPSGAVLITDAPVDNHGKGESFSPTDLLATSLATCIITVMSIQAKVWKLDLKGLKFKVSKEMGSDPRKIDKITIDLFMPFEVSEKDQERLHKAAETCPVHYSLHSDVQKEVIFHWK